jgi:hypothetical protein
VDIQKIWKTETPIVKNRKTSESAALKPLCEIAYTKNLAQAFDTDAEKAQVKALSRSDIRLAALLKVPNLRRWNATKKAGIETAKNHLNLTELTANLQSSCGFPAVSWLAYITLTNGPKIASVTPNACAEERCSSKIIFASMTLMGMLSEARPALIVIGTVDTTERSNNAPKIDKIIPKIRYFLAVKGFLPPRIGLCIESNLM